MTLEADAVLDRRRLRRRLMRWRIAAIILAFLALLVLVVQDEELAASMGFGEHIARIKVEGLIRENAKRIELIDKLAKAGNVRAVIVYINSPGGTTVGGESLFVALRKLSKKKPVVAVFGTIATSAAYIVGLATDHIVARGNTITGSVGVIFQWAEVHQLLQKLGVTVREVKSGALKANPSMFAPLDEKGRALAQEMVAESQRWFVDLVRKRRSIDPASVPGLEDGRIYSGRQALRHRLIDATGGEKAAIAWLEKERKIAKGLSVVEWTIDGDGELSWVKGAASALASLLAQAAPRIAGILAEIAEVQRIHLDGLLSIWHPR